MKLSSVFAAAAVAVSALSTLQGSADAVVVHTHLKDPQKHLRRRHHLLHSKAVVVDAEKAAAADGDAGDAGDASSSVDSEEVVAEDSGSWDSQDVVETMRPKVHHVNWGQSDAPSAAGSSSGTVDDSVLALMNRVPTADQQYLPQVASVTSVDSTSLPFGLNDAKTAVLLVSAVGAVAGVVIALVVAVVLRRQSRSEPGFGPVELASDLPDPETVTAAVEQQDNCKLEARLQQDEDEEAAFTNAS